MPLAERLALGFEYLYKLFLKRERRGRHQLKLHLLTQGKQGPMRPLPASGTQPDATAPY